MSSTRLKPRAVERPWGRRSLSGGLAPFSSGELVGEIWHETADGSDADLLVKHLFTSERLSIQVHPDDRQARALGLRRGKAEAWLIVEAAPDARLGLGLKRHVSREVLRSAALDGSIEELLDWRAVKAGDFFYSPAGTIHAIGAGLSLIEIQQNLDLTYRLYDYGRPRQLHLEEAVEVAAPSPWRALQQPDCRSGGRTVLISGATFVVERWEVKNPVAIATATTKCLAISVGGHGSIDGAPLREGMVVQIEGESKIVPQAPLDLLITYPGAAVIEGLLRAAVPR